jgi:hypothetical protein
MSKQTRLLWSASAFACAVALAAVPAAAQPKTNMLHQWSEG